MKLRMITLMLCILLLCSGCTAMLERSYDSSVSHVDYSVTEDSSILRAESYQALVNSILYFVSEHVGSGTIRLYNYTGNVDADLQSACSEVMESDPLGAYAVRSLDYESTRILTYYEVNFTITYRRSIAEVAEIRTISGLNGVRQELEQMVDSRVPHTALRTAYFDGDTQLVSDLFWLSFYNTPDAVLEPPTLEVTFYPEDGTQRILEVEALWSVTSGEVAQYRQSLSDTASALTETAPPAGNDYTVEELAALLRSTVLYDPSGDFTALAALQGEAVNDLGMLLGLEYLYQQNGIEVSVVSDTSGAQMWLIVLTPSGYRHLLPRDLRPDTQADTVDPSAPDSEQPVQTPDQADTGSGTLWQLPLYTDEELAALGFEWPRNLHPACVDYSGTVPE